MNPILRNILAVIGGYIVGSIVNMGLVMIGINVIPPPEGVDVMNPESLKASIHLFETKHMVFPFLAHAIGTLVGAAVAVKIAISHHLKIALAIGCLFLLGGIWMAFTLPETKIFNTIDLLLAYIPMAWLGYRLAKK